MRPLRLRVLVALSIAMVVLLVSSLAGTSLLAWMRLATIGDLPSKTGQVRIAQIQRVADVRFGVTQASSALRLAMLAQTPEDLDKTTASIAATRDQVDRTLSMWRLDIVTPSGQQRFEQVEQLVAQFWQRVDTDVEHLRAGRKDEALATLMMATTPHLGKLYSALEYEQDRQGHLLSASIASVEEIVWTVRNHILIWIVAIVAGLLALCLHMVRTLKRRQVPCTEA